MMWMIASVPFWASGLFCVRSAVRCIQAPCMQLPAAGMTLAAGAFFVAAAALVAS